MKIPEFMKDSEYWTWVRITSWLWLALVAGWFIWVTGVAFITNETIPMPAGGFKPREGLMLFGAGLYTLFAFFSTIPDTDDGQP